MRNPVRALVAASLLSVSLWGGKLIAPGPDDVLTPDEVVIRLKPNGVISTVLAGFNNTVSVAAAQSNLNLYLLKVPSAVRDVILQQLAALNEVEYAEPNRIRTASGITPDDRSFATQWWLTKMQATAAWSIYPGRFPAAGAFGTRVRVAILDTGGNCTHPDFINSGGSGTDIGSGGQFNWALSQAFVATTAAGAACPWQDDHGHGTHVAGTVASATNNGTGVASLGFPAELVIFKVLNYQGNGNDFTIAQAITAATDAGARVISMSLGGSGYSQALQDAVNYAWNHDALVVAAAGNSNSSALFYPGDANYAMGIGATDSADARASFSNYGFGLDVMAPGVSIYSTYLNGGYTSMSGTSMATPNVSALAALILAATPNLSADAVMQRIEMSADTTTGNGLWDLYKGFGRINAYSALSGILPSKGGGGLVGQVVDPAGNAIASAAIGMGGLNGTTDANGLFRFANVPPATYTFTASGGGYPARSQTVVVPPGADTHVRLELGVSTGVFSGTVRDGSTPLRNVVVQALSAGLVRQATVTDANGLYTLTVVAGTYDLRISAVGRSTRVSAGAAVASGATTTVDFDMPALGTITGIVTNTTAAAVSGAQVTAYNATDSGGASTAANGSYTTLALPAGTYTVVVNALNNLPLTVNNVVVADGVATPLNLQLTSTATVSALTLSPTTVGGGGATAANTITLTSPAGAGGAVVTLSSNKPQAALPPATVTVPAGATVSNPFTINTSAVSVSTTATISASLGGITKTANLTVVPYTIYTLYISPAVVGGGAVTTSNRVQLNVAAPPGGAVITLASNTPGVTVPPSVNIAAGATLSDYFNVTTTSVTVPVQVSITATYGTATKTATLTVNPTSLSSFSANPQSTAGGKPLSSASVKLDSPAPAGGAIVQLTSSDPAVQLPSTVTIPAGATVSANIPITTSIVGVTTQAVLTATYAGASKTVTITVTPPALSAFSLTATIAGGKPITNASVTLTGPAPAGGLAVTLTSSDPAVTPPATVTVPAGATGSGYFSMPTSIVAAPVVVTLTAVGGGVAKTATVTVKPSALVSITANPATVSGSKSITSTVNLDGPAGPSGAVVTLSSTDPSVTPPATVTVPAGATTSGNFTIPTTYVSASTSVTLTATLNGISKTAVLTVKPAALATFSISPLTIAGGKPITSASVTLDGPAGPAGALVTLASSDPSVTPPVSVTVPAGATTSGNFTIPTKGVSGSTAVTVTATYSGVSKSVALTVKPPALNTLTINPVLITGGKPITSAQLSLDGPAGAAGASIALTSTDPSVIPPASVLVPAGATSSGNFTINTVWVASATQVTVTATYAGISKAVTVTVKPPALSGFSVSPTTLSGGKPITSASLTLDGPAGAAGVSIALASTDPSVIPPATVFIPAGATSSGNFTINTVWVASATQATVTATYGGVSKPMIITVKPPTLSGFSVATATVSGGKPFTSASLALDGPAGPAGATVSLASSDPAVTPPPTFTIPAGASSSGYFSLPTSAVNTTVSVTLTATFGGVTKTFVVTVKPTAVATLAVNPTTISGGKLIPSAILTLDGPAPPGGANVSIQSSSPSAVPPAIVTVPAGATNSAYFSIPTNWVTATDVATITASYGGVSKSVNVTVKPTDLSALSVSPASAKGGTKITVGLSIDGPAAPGGLAISLASTNPAVPLPATLLVPAGATSASLSVTTSAVAASTPVTVTASYGSVVKTATVTLNP